MEPKLDNPYEQPNAPQERRKNLSFLRKAKVLSPAGVLVVLGSLFPQLLGDSPVDVAAQNPWDVPQEKVETFDPRAAFVEEDAQETIGYPGIEPGPRADGTGAEQVLAPESVTEEAHSEQVVEPGHIARTQEFLEPDSLEEAKSPEMRREQVREVFQEIFDALPKDEELGSLFVQGVDGGSLKRKIAQNLAERLGSALETYESDLVEAFTDAISKQHRSELEEVVDFDLLANTLFFALHELYTKDRLRPFLLDLGRITNTGLYYFVSGDKAITKDAFTKSLELQEEVNAPHYDEFVKDWPWISELEKKDFYAILALHDFAWRLEMVFGQIDRRLQQGGAEGSLPESLMPLYQSIRSAGKKLPKN